MKRILLSLLCAFVVGSVWGEGPQFDRPAVYPYNAQANYQLFPTNNFYNFIKLDTRTGQIWVVQYDLDGPNTFQTVLSSKERNYDGEVTPGRFNLYPSKNSYNYIMLDQKTGRVWQVQWDTDPKHYYVAQIFEQ